MLSSSDWPGCGSPMLCYVSSLPFGPSGLIRSSSRLPLQAHRDGDNQADHDEGDESELRDQFSVISSAPPSETHRAAGSPLRGTPPSLREEPGSV
ncbi:hypothetical protein EYF80_066575 [Liparis tanakae]|uniref:Uncharacterized protein n=1 Tax=Liparis tanakae TaxID=230148 RepID=A0A4Z2E323_9TELE|nr:hypothetical protein EYF80_066575 [Liparis tanakae]